MPKSKGLTPPERVSSPSLVAASAAIVLLLGVMHLIYTLYGLGADDAVTLVEVPSLQVPTLGDVR